MQAFKVAEFAQTLRLFYSIILIIIMIIIIIRNPNDMLEHPCRTLGEGLLLPGRRALREEPRQSVVATLEFDSIAYHHLMVILIDL